MGLIKEDMEKLIKILGYKPQNGEKNVYSKIYNTYIIKVNFNTQKIEYGEGIKIGDMTTSNFSKSENLVVLECVDKLLEKGYLPETIHLEYKWLVGKKEKGKLDILVKDKKKKVYLMIECKTWGSEYEKEVTKLLKDGGQLFSYYAQDRSAQYLCLYTSRLQKDNVDYKNKIIKIDTLWKNLDNQKEIFSHWNKNLRENGVFDKWVKPYEIRSKNITRGELKELSSGISGKIFNQFAEILRHNVISDKSNAFNKILNLFICKIIDENKNDDEEVDFQWKDSDNYEKLQSRLNNLYKEGMQYFLNIEVTDYTDEYLNRQLVNLNNVEVVKEIKAMFSQLRLKKNPEFAFKEVYDEQSFEENAIVVKEIVELLQTYQFRYSHKQQFLGDFFELLLNTSMKQEVGQFFTPIPIARFIVSSLPIVELIEEKLKSGESELLPLAIDYAAGSGHFLTEWMEKLQEVIEKIDDGKLRPKNKKQLKSWKENEFIWAKDYVYGIEADYRLVKTAKVNSFLNGDGEANIIQANGLDSFLHSKNYIGKLKHLKNDTQDNGNFDVVISNPPYSVSAFKNTIKNGDKSFELYKFLTESSSEIECLFIERTKQLLKEKGVAGIILPSSILSNLGIYTKTREIILKYFKIISIVELGSNTFMATGTNTVILFLERKNDYEYHNVKNEIDNFFQNFHEVVINNIETPISKYLDYAWKGLDIDDYISLIKKVPNDKVKQHELFLDYSELYQKYKNSLDLLIQKEKDKLYYFVMLYYEKLLLVNSGEKLEEKQFLGYEFSNRRGRSGIHPINRGKTIEECTKLYGSDTNDNREKVDVYIREAFKGNINLSIHKELEKNISYSNLIDLMVFDRADFQKEISLIKKNEIEFRWPMKKLKDFADIKGGDSFPKEFQGMVESTKSIPFYKVSDMNVEENGLRMNVSNNYVSSNIIKERIKSTIFPEGTIIFPKVGKAIETNKKRILTSKSCVDNNIMGIIIKNKQLNPFYLLFYFIYHVNLKKLASSSNPPSISTNKLASLKIPIPNIEMQDDIVGKMSEFERKEASYINEIEKLKKSILNFFSVNTDRLYKLSSLALLIKRGKTAKYGKSDIQIIKSGQARGLREIDFSTRHFVSEKFVLDERKLEKGDILINSTGTGTAGRVTLFDIDGVFVVDNHITILRLDRSKALPLYILYSLVKIGFKNIEKMALGQSGQIELSISTIENIKLSIPDIEKQKLIVNEIKKIEGQIEILENNLISIRREKENYFINAIS